MVGASNWLRGVYHEQLPAPAVPQAQARSGNHDLQREAFEAFGQDRVAVGGAPGARWPPAPAPALLGASIGSGCGHALEQQQGPRRTCRPDKVLPVAGVP
jgi:hypothetical protein